VNVRLEKHSEGRATRPARRADELAARDFAQSVAHWPEVVACYAMTGEMDYLLRVHVEDMDHFSRFMMEDPAAPPGGAGREVELCAAADQGYDGAADGVRKGAAFASFFEEPLHRGAGLLP
jgi:DNA-binding Lrp family transcriptional regulator